MSLRGCPAMVPAGVLGMMLMLMLPTVWADDSDAPLLSTGADLMDNMPAHFPRFYFEGAEEDARWLSRFLWYHFDTRLANNDGMFNKEYLTLADLWLADATHRKDTAPIQAVHREDLLDTPIHDEGYMHTNQHQSHAHDWGWPFPLWIQVPGGPKGHTAGFHFQNQPGRWFVMEMILPHEDNMQYAGDRATEGWELIHLRSKGIEDFKWRLEATGRDPVLVTPAWAQLDAFQAPFLQLRWTRTGEPPHHQLPYLEWLREGDREYSPERRVYLHSRWEKHSPFSQSNHAIMEMYRHPLWTGKIKRMRIHLAPGESDVSFGIDSFFTVYDTRHAINNPVYTFACWNYFRWTGDLDFLRRVITKLRIALRYQQTVMGGLEHKFIRNPWPGHDGIPGLSLDAEGNKVHRPGHGIGNNYYDLVPFGGDDMYATSQYYASTLAMAELEEAILANPGWNMPRGTLMHDPDFLRKHAAEVKEVANRKFWDDDKGRFVGCIDAEGNAHDFGFVFVNQEAIWYDIATPEHARTIMEWIGGERIVEGDTSTGEDIYHWRFGPRATTKRNIEYYGHVWTAPEVIEWGGQVQDGGAVLGFAFFDMWAYLKVYGPDRAWDRLRAILEWEREVHAAGGYREYYKDGRHGTTLQGCNTPGGLGIDCEFFESSLVPSIVTYGFLGLNPQADALHVDPALPSQCPAMGINNLLYRFVRMDVRVSADAITVRVHEDPATEVFLAPAGEWQCDEINKIDDRFMITSAGTYRFTRVP